MGRETIDRTLSDLGERMGMPGLRLDKAGACQLLFDQRWLVTVTDLPQFCGVGLHCAVTTAGDAPRLGASALLAMLRASFQGSGAGGATLCVGPDQRAYLQRVVPLPDADCGRVQNALEQLLDHAEAWSDRLARPGEPAPPAATANAQAGWAMQRV